MNEEGGSRFQARPPQDLLWHRSGVRGGVPFRGDQPRPSGDNLALAAKVQPAQTFRRHRRRDNAATQVTKRARKANSKGAQNGIKWHGSRRSLSGAREPICAWLPATGANLDICPCRQSRQCRPVAVCPGQCPGLESGQTVMRE